MCESEWHYDCVVYIECGSASGLCLILFNTPMNGKLLMMKVGLGDGGLQMNHDRTQ